MNHVTLNAKDNVLWTPKTHKQLVDGGKSLLFTEKTFLLELGFEVTEAWKEAQLLRVIDELGELGIRLASRFLYEKLELTISCIKSLGMEAIDIDMTEGVLDAAVSLGLIGQEAARNKGNKTVLEIALALKALGIKLADKDVLTSLLLVAISLKEVGKEAARNGMEREVILSQAFLREIYTFSRGSKNNFKTLNQEFSFLIRDIERCSKEAGLNEAAMSARILFENFSPP